jgi:hypothetical protein
MLNRLNGQRAYLAGAIDRVLDRGVGWRDSISPFLKNLEIHINNPLKKLGDLGIEDSVTHLKKKTLKETQDYENLSFLMKEVRRVDLRLVDVSDFLIVNLDLDTHPCGTYEEIFWANRQKKPIIVHVEQNKRSAPDWLFGTMPHQMIFSTWLEVKDYLNYINNSENIETFNRWYFT